MPVTAQSLVDEVIDQWGFDVDAATGLKWLNRRHKTMVRRGRSNRRTIEIGVTVAGQSDYPVAAFDVYSVTVGEVPYRKARRSDQRAYTRGQLVWTPSDVGLFVAKADENGASQLGLIPPPGEAGLTIEVFAAVAADDLTLTSELLVDEDYHEGLQEGMAATGYARDSEQMGAADRCEARFDAKCEELRQETARRFRGHGPAQIRVNI